MLNFRGKIDKHTIFCGHLRLIDNSHDIQTSNGASILGGLTLGIVEVGRDSDHSMSDLKEKGFKKLSIIHSFCPGRSFFLLLYSLAHCYTFLPR